MIMKMHYKVEDLNVNFLFIFRSKIDQCIDVFDSFQHFSIFGYARSKMTDAELRNMVSRTLTCRIDKR